SNPLEAMAERTYRYLESRTEHGILVLTLKATHIQDDDVAEALRQEMLAALADAGCRDVVVDFRHTRYLSSVAFRPLLALHRQLQQRGGCLVLCHLSPTVGDVFYTTRLVSGSGATNAPFELEPDLDAALT